MIINFAAFFSACKEVVNGKANNQSLGKWLFGFDADIREKGFAKETISRLIAGKEKGKRLEKALCNAKSQDIVDYFRKALRNELDSDQTGVKIAEDGKVLAVFSILLMQTDNMTNLQKQSIKQYLSNDSIPELFASLLYFSVTQAILRLPPHVDRNLPPSLYRRGYWISRDKEYEILCRLLQQGEKEIFVTGNPGLGKTEFVISCANELREKYRFLYTRFAGSWEDVVLSLRFNRWKAEKYDANTKKWTRKSAQEEYREKIAFLQKFKMQDNVILVVDQFDGDAEKLLTDPVRAELSRLEIQILYTTRMPLKGKTYIEIKPFRVTQFQPMIEHYLGRSYSRQELVYRLIMEVDCNTLLVDLILRLLEMGKNPEAVLKSLCAKNWSDIREKVAGEYHRDESSKTLLSHLLTLFDVSGLSQDERYVLQCASLLSANGLKRDTFLQCLGQEEKWLEVQERLRRSGWLGLDMCNFSVVLQPMIQVACQHSETTKPSSACLPFLFNAMEASTDMTEPYAIDCQLSALFMNAIDILPPDDEYTEVHRDLHAMVGKLYSKSGKNKEAIGHIQQALAYFGEKLEEKQDKWWLCLFLGALFTASGAYAQAQNLYQELETTALGFVEFDDLLPQFYADRSYLAYMQKAYSQALDLAQNGVQALDKTPDCESACIVDTYRMLFRAYIAVDQSEDALGNISNMLQVLSNCEEPDVYDVMDAYKLIVEVYIAAGYYALALEHAERCLQLSAKYAADLVAEAWEAMADALAALERYPEALEYRKLMLQKYTQELANHDPELGVAHYEVGKYALYTKDLTKAKHHMEKAIEIFLKTRHPKHPIFKTINQALQTIQNLQQRNFESIQNLNDSSTTSFHDCAMI